MISRRSLLELSLLAVGILPSTAMRAVMAGATVGRDPRKLFSAVQRANVRLITELIIPKTDTPGAIEAGVPEFVETMVADWYTQTERQIFLDGLDGLDAASTSSRGRSFAASTVAEQTAALEALERDARDYRSPPPTQSALYGSVVDEQTPFFNKLKELTVLGYYTSELGATQELRYNPVPGHFDGNVPFASIGRQWSS